MPSTGHPFLEGPSLLFLHCYRDQSFRMQHFSATNSFFFLKKYHLIIKLVRTEAILSSVFIFKCHSKHPNFPLEWQRPEMGSFAKYNDQVVGFNTTATLLINVLLDCSGHYHQLQAVKHRLFPRARLHWFEASQSNVHSFYN